MCPRKEPGNKAGGEHKRLGPVSLEERKRSKEIMPVFQCKRERNTMDFKKFSQL
jgi:hypothetical protein